MFQLFSLENFGGRVILNLQNQSYVPIYKLKLIANYILNLQNQTYFKLKHKLITHYN